MPERALNKVTVNDVGPRDGLQNQPKILSPAERVQLVRALLTAGMDHVEVGAFVSPKVVPARLARVPALVFECRPSVSLRECVALRRAHCCRDRW